MEFTKQSNVRDCPHGPARSHGLFNYVHKKVELRLPLYLGLPFSYLVSAVSKVIMTGTIGETCWGHPTEFIQGGIFSSSFSYFFTAFFAARPWLRRKDNPLVPLQIMFIILTVAIGITSAMFHLPVFGWDWTYYVHTVPIVIFVIAYIAVALHDFVGFKPMLSFIVSLSAGSVFVSFLYATPKFGFFPIPPFMVLIAAGAYFNNGSKTAAKLILCAALVSVAIVFRWLDLPLCDRFPFGLHSIWHLLSATAIWWLIRIHRVHSTEHDEESSVSS